jgi:linoleoyl-CoA desaturase
LRLFVAVNAGPPRSPKEESKRLAITDISAFAHLTDADIEILAVELDAIRLDIEDSRGEHDARYIHRTIAAQRVLEVAGRLMLAASLKRSAWWAGTLSLALAKIIENMEVGHNVLHGQWNWMNDPEIHSSTWEWDMSGASKHWQYTHNFQHHKYTNILGMDDDVGYSTLRVTRDQPWKPYNIGNLMFNTILALGFEWGIGWQPIEFGKVFKDGSDRETTLLRVREFSAKAGKATGQGLRRFPGADLAVAGGDIQIDVEGQPGGQPVPQRVGQSGDLLRAVPRRRREIHQDRHDRRNPGSVVSAPDAGQRQL